MLQMRIKLKLRDEKKLKSRCNIFGIFFPIRSRHFIKLSTNFMMGRGSGIACDMRCQLLNTEFINKENELRRKWFVRNRQRLIDNLGRQMLDGTAKATISERQSRNDRKFSAPEFETKHEELPKFSSWRPADSGASVNLNHMRPVDPNVRDILYENGLESSVAGQNYLRERYKQKPENRFYFPECNSWVYGWRMKDYPPVPLSKVGMRSILHAALYRRNTSSLQRDAGWYRAPLTGNSKNFNEILTY